MIRLFRLILPVVALLAALPARAEVTSRVIGVGSGRSDRSTIQAGPMKASRPSFGIS